MKQHSLSFKAWMRIFAMPIFGVLLYIIAFFLVSDETFDEYYERYGGLAYVYDLTIAIIWSAINLEISFIVTDWFDRWLPWTKQALTRFLAQTLVQLILTTALVIACLLSYRYVFQLEAWQNYDVVPIVAPTAVLAGFMSLMVMGFHVGSYFLQRWQASQLEAEQLKQVNLESHVQMLTQQLDPHFLFNNFNTLATLIEEDAQAARQFLMRMSDVYRYVLQQRDKKLALLEEEAEVIRAYTYLLTERFGNKLSVDIAIPDHLLSKKLPVLTLQNLVENAVKHNVVNAEQPLLIQVTASDNNLQVQNNFQPKQRSETSHGVGLKNIRERYKLMGAPPVIVQQNEHFFTVRVPLLD